MHRLFRRIAQRIVMDTIQVAFIFADFYKYIHCARFLTNTYTFIVHVS